MTPAEHYCIAEDLLDVDLPLPGEPMDGIRELRVQLALAHAVLATVPRETALAYR